MSAECGEVFLDEQRSTAYRVLMKSTAAALLTFATGVVAITLVARSPIVRAASPSWNARAAAGYLDARQEWWQHWPNAARDHDTQCVSCHTALPYALVLHLVNFIPFVVTGAFLLHYNARHPRKVDAPSLPADRSAAPISEVG